MHYTSLIKHFVIGCYYYNIQKVQLKAHLCSTLNRDLDTDGAVSARFHKAHAYGPNGAVPPETMGGSVAVTTQYVALVRHEEEITMAELF